MRLLLDTHILLWGASEPGRLSVDVLALLEDAENELFFSAASIWEVALKAGRDRTELRVDPGVLRRALIDNGYTEVPIMGLHSAALGGLPPVHRDPFDRILIAQALVEGITLVTSDAMVARYPGPILRV
jgi:PIN domain nuclease of toxin-antitoxin system